MQRLEIKVWRLDSAPKPEMKEWRLHRAPRDKIPRKREVLPTKWRPRYVFLKKKKNDASEAKDLKPAICNHVMTILSMQNI